MAYQERAAGVAVPGPAVVAVVAVAEVAEEKEEVAAAACDAIRDDGGGGGRCFRRSCRRQVEQLRLRRLQLPRMRR